VKRLFDIVVSALGLLLTSPLLLLAAIAVRLAGPGPVFFRQERMGRGLVPFKMLKFRTMVVGADKSGPGVTVRDDARITPVGRWLRDSKLDELPQLVNVLRGEMSIVGPRPELERYVRRFEPEFREVLRVRPGLTDPATLAFRREAELLHGDEDPEARYLREILPEKLRMERAYAEHASFWSDLALVMRTVFAIVYPADTLDRLLAWLARHHGIWALLVQALAAVAAQALALLLRFDGNPPANERELALRALPLLLLARLVWMRVFRLDRDLWRHVSPSEAADVTASVALGTLTFWGLVSVFFPGSGYPRSVIVLDGLLCATLWIGLRVLRRLHRGLSQRVPSTRRAIVVGPADAAARLLLELAGREPRTHHAIGLVVDVVEQAGLSVHGIPILGGYDRLETIVASRAPDAVLVAASALATPGVRDALGRVRQVGRAVHVMPELNEVMEGRAAELVLDAPATDGLLFRDPVQVDEARLGERFRGRRVMVTGAGGSIGSEICEQLAAFAPANLVLFEKHEAALYEIDRRLRDRHPGLALESCIGDVRDAARVEEVVSSTRPEMVFHAAAYKHVPLMEKNPGEAFKTNVIGTKTVAETCGRAGVGVFVLVSTDKAVEPVSVMGASKRLAELAVAGLAPRHRTRFLTVRFGNVLGSSGSVVPLFREQVQHSRPVTVTHANVTRWFMTIPEAVRLILEAGRLGQGGEVFILDMGRPVRILDLAHSIIREQGREPGRDVPVVFTGLRPGERLFEKLTRDDETLWKTPHPRIFVARPGLVNGHGAAKRLAELRALLHMLHGDSAAAGSPELRAATQELEGLCA
jgi:FlaA1/EpsC-like NDP-sugar epimerase/lipopolysaccharide/colanic/teichoic acid biosynthesis glycosyltransferase